MFVFLVSCLFYVSFACLRVLVWWRVRSSFCVVVDVVVMVVTIALGGVVMFLLVLFMSLLTLVSSFLFVFLFLCCSSDFESC